MYHKLAVGCDKSIFLYVSTASKENGTGYAAVNLQVLHIPYTQIPCSEMDSAAQINHIWF